MVKLPPEIAGAVVLLVEDEPIVRMVAADVLLEAGFCVVEAASGDEAKALLNERSDVRVLFTDVRMPGRLNGIELAHIVDEQRLEIGIIVASGHAEPRPGDLPQRALFLQKPYYPSQMIDAVVSVIDMARYAKEAILVEDAAIVTSGPPAADALKQHDRMSKAGKTDSEAEFDRKTVLSD